MARRIVNLGATARGRAAKSSFMAVQGRNTRELSQLLDVNYAQKIQNLLIDANGQLIKRSGLEKLAEVTLTTDYTLNEQYYGDYKIVGYDTTVSVINEETGAETTIKTDFSGGAPISGQKYGNYFFVGTGANYEEKIGRISIVLNYDSQTADFTVGSIVTGGTSGATAIILEDSDSGTSGTLTLGNIVGEFEDDETITDDAGGSADANGVIGYNYEQITAAPKARIIYAFLAPSGSTAGTRLFAGNLKDDRASLQYSAVDDGSNPPWDDWSSDNTVDTGGTYNNRNHGELNTIASLGEQVIVGYESGDAGFRIQTIEIAEVTSKVTPSDFDNPESGMAKGAITTSLGVFYGVPKSGFFQLITAGSTNVPYSRNSNQISFNLGDDYFDDVNMDNLSIVHDTKRHLVLFSIGKDSELNNIVLAYNTDTKAWTEHTMNISEFTKRDETLYGSSSVDGRYFKVFTGNTDDGKSIPTEYVQEVNVLGLDDLFDLWDFKIQARLGEGSQHFIDFQIYNRDGKFVSEAIDTRVITGVTPMSQLLSWGSAGYGETGYGGGARGGEVTTQPYQTDGVYIPQAWRMIIRLTSNDKLPASYNFFIATIVDREEKLLLNNITTLTDGAEVLSNTYVDDVSDIYVDDLGNIYVDL
jgi:hypothetical protein